MMDSKYLIYLDYVTRILKSSGNDTSTHSPFRSRSKHCYRVFVWANRLCKYSSTVDKDVLFTSAIFHDIGYAFAPKDTHQLVGAEMFYSYAKNKGLSAEFIDKVTESIKLHTHKDLLSSPEKLSLEQILLMESDLLDEEGAMAVCRGHLRSGYDSIDSYEKALISLTEQYQKKAKYNPMVTQEAKNIWDNKRAFFLHYLEELSIDLCFEPQTGMEMKLDE